MSGLPFGDPLNGAQRPFAGLAFAVRFREGTWKIIPVSKWLTMLSFRPLRIGIPSPSKWAIFMAEIHGGYLLTSYIHWEPILQGKVPWGPKGGHRNPARLSSPFPVAHRQLLEATWSDVKIWVEVEQPWDIGWLMIMITWWCDMYIWMFIYDIWYDIFKVTWCFL